MEINKIKYFKVVYETKSIRKAAELLQMSPGSLSKSIKSLEDELEVQLFKSDGRNITPTDSARKTYTKALTLLKSYDEFKNDLMAEARSVKTLRIATWEVFSTYLISSLANTEKDISDLNLLVLEKVPSELEKAILNDDADIGISYEPIPHPELEFTKIKSFKFGVYCAKHLEKSKNLQQTPFAVPVTVINDSIFNTQSLDNWPEDIKRSIKYRFEMLETALETTRSGLSLIHCPDFVINLQNKYLKSQYNLVPFNYNSKLRSISKDIYLVTRKSYPETTLAKKVAKAIRMYC